MNTNIDTPTRKVYCAFDDEGVYVYQAFSPHIVADAVENGTFGKGFGLDRTTWIKPSFAWILQRSDYATKHRMEAIARIKLHHWAWLEILENSVQAHFDSNLYASKFGWQIALKKSQAICQWDPERGLDGKRLHRQAIQLGLKAPILTSYLERYIIRVEDVTQLAIAIAPIARRRETNFPPVLEEREYPLELSIALNLGCTR